MKEEKVLHWFSSINNLNVGKLRTKGYKAAVENKQDAIIVEGSEEYLEKELTTLIDLNKIDAIMALDQESSLAAYRIGKKETSINK